MASIIPEIADIDEIDLGIGQRRYAWPEVDIYRYDGNGNQLQLHLEFYCKPWIDICRMVNAHNDRYVN